MNFSKALKKSISVLLVGAMTASVSVCAFAQDNSNVDYKISNPYSTVNWSSDNQYKADLHCHTTASDGKADFNSMVEQHYALNYAALALTDHGTVDYGWTEETGAHSLPIFQALQSMKDRDLNYLTDERYTEITTPGKDGKVMMRVPYGIELNPTSFNNAHVNSWFADYGDGKLGGTSDYETVIKGVQKAGGLCVINHPGEYTEARYDTYENAYGPDYDYQVTKFTSLLLKYDSCIGIDVNSKGDKRTQNDRKLWDILLQNCIPNGRSVLAIASSDAHYIDVVDTGWTVHVMPEMTVDSLKANIKQGAFFAAARNIYCTEDLKLMSAALGVNTIANQKDNVDDANYRYWKCERYVTENSWSEELGCYIRETVEAPDAPVVTDITVDNTADKISITADNTRLIRWIADGKQIAYTTVDGKTENGTVTSVMNLNDYSDQIGSYVRAEIWGDGGILYTQAFTLDYDGAPEAKDFSKFFDYANLLAGLRDGVLTVLNLVPGWPLFWKLLTGRFSTVG